VKTRSGKDNDMKKIDILAAVLVVVGALNWGLVGAFKFDLVATLLGDGTGGARAVYLLVGLAAVFQAASWRAIQRRWSAGALKTATAVYSR
jgi:uncharacterized protein